MVVKCLCFQERVLGGVQRRLMNIQFRQLEVKLIQVVPSVCFGSGSACFPSLISLE